MLRDVSLQVASGEVLAILGASGCGKSTLLRIAGGLDRPTVGGVRIDDGPVVGIDARCAVAFQEPRLLPWRTLAGNVALGCRPGRIRDTGSDRVAELLDLVGLGPFARVPTPRGLRRHGPARVPGASPGPGPGCPAPR